MSGLRNRTRRIMTAPMDCSIKKDGDTMALFSPSIADLSVKDSLKAMNISII